MKTKSKVLTLAVLQVSSLQCIAAGSTINSGWQLIWNDEFNGHALDLSKWEHEVNCWGGGNNEKQCYVADEKNAFVQDGKLTIRLIKGDTTGPDSVQGSADYGKTTKTLPYSSARLRTMNNGDWKYGRFEIRAKLPAGQGTWPAIWMLPTDYVYGGWAASGEIDIMEAVNLKTSYEKEDETLVENRVHGTLHYGKSWPNNVHAGVEYDFANSDINPADDYHVYALEWQKGEMRWYVDGKHFATQTMDGWWSQYQDDEGNWVSGPEDAPYNQDFHLILNLAMGGAWPEAVNDTGIDDSIEQADMLIDYVRVYQCKYDVETGIGCESLVSDTAEYHKGVEEPALPVSIDMSDISLTLTNDSGVVDGYTLNGYTADASDSRIVVGDTIELVFDGAGNSFFTAKSALDLTDYANWMMKFDLKVTSLGSNNDIYIKMDSGWPNVSDVLLSETTTGLVADGHWYSYEIPLSDFVAADNSYSPGSKFDISNVVNPFVIEGGGGENLKVSITNIRFEEK